MGMIQSVLCSVVVCVERVMTWTCCAFLLMLMLFTIVLLMVYGISVGYHYAQKELASFAMSSRSTTEASPENVRRSGGGYGYDSEDPAVVRLLAVNRSQVGHPAQPLLEDYRPNKPDGQPVYMEEKAKTPIVVLETERPPAEPELSPHERALAKRLIGRFRRSKNITDSPFLRPLRNTTELLQLAS